jgi:hypothetical protein
MTFKDTRLYELLRIIGMGCIGALLFVIALNVAQSAAGTIEQFFQQMQLLDDINMQFEAQKSSLLALDHLTSAQVDELIAIEREITVLASQGFYATSMQLYKEVEVYLNRLVILLGILGLLLIVLSIFVPRYADFMALLGAGFVALNPLLYNFNWWLYGAFATAGIVILLLQHYAKVTSSDTTTKQARRKFALKVIGAYVIALAIVHVSGYMSTKLAVWGSEDMAPTLGQMFGATDFDEERYNLMQATHLTEAQKQRFVVIEKEMLKAQQDAEQIRLLREQEVMTQNKKSGLIRMLIVLLFAAIMSFSTAPFYVRYGCIFGALLVMYDVLPYVGFAIGGIFAVLLLAVVAYRLYRLPRV